MVGGEGINWRLGLTCTKKLYIKRITNKDLLYSTGNFTQYSVMTYMGIESKRRVDTCIYINDSLFSRAEMNSTVNQLYSNKN